MPFRTHRLANGPGAPSPALFHGGCGRIRTCTSHRSAVLQTAAASRIGPHTRSRAWDRTKTLLFQRQGCCQLHHPGIIQRSIRFIWLRDKDSNLESPGSRPGMLPFTPSRKIKNPPIAFGPRWVRALQIAIWVIRTQHHLEPCSDKISVRLGVPRI